MMNAFSSIPARCGLAIFCFLLVDGEILAQAAPDAEADALAERAGEAYRAEEFSRAGRLFGTAATLNGHHPVWAYNAAVAHARAGDRAPALEWLARAAALGAAYEPAATDAFEALNGDTDFERLVARFRTNSTPVVGSDTAFVLEERDLMPESIAYDADTGAFYAGSIYRRKIVRRRADGVVEDFVAEGEHGLWGVLGIKIDPERRELWANACNLGDDMAMARPDPGTVGRAGVFRFDLDSGALIARYGSEGLGPRTCFNDLVIAASGEVYVSAGGNGVFRIGPAAERPEPFLAADGLRVNGLALSADGGRLYLTNGSRGIAIADLSSRSLRALQLPADVTLNWVDGLYVYERSLVGIQNGLRPQRTVQAFLDQAGEAVTALRIIDSDHPAFASPTTGVVVRDSLYYVATTQLRSAFRADGTMRPWNELKINVILRARLLSIGRDQVRDSTPAGAGRHNRF